MKLAFVTQELDPDHPALAQTVDLVRALATRVERLEVATRRVRTAVPPNAAVYTFDAGSRPGRVVSFERAILRATGSVDAVFVHMVPEFALLSAPVCKLRRLPLLLWYTHWNGSSALRAATRVVDAALSVDASSYPVHTNKLHAIGHAIDVEAFSAAPPSEDGGPLRVLALGRTARWKGLVTLLDATAELAASGTDVTLEIRGPSLTPDEVAHRQELAARISDDFRLRERVALLDAVPRSEIPAVIARCDLVVSPNEPRVGSTLDKAVFEAAASARLVLSTNAAFAPVLGGLPLALIAPPGDSAALASAIGAVAAASAAERNAVGAELRRRVMAGHSVDHWADAVISVVGEVRSSRGRAGPAGAG